MTGDRVEVTGAPEVFSVSGFRAEFGLPLAGEHFRALEGTRCLVVRKVTLLQDARGGDSTVQLIVRRDGSAQGAA